MFLQLSKSPTFLLRTCPKLELVHLPSGKRVSTLSADSLANLAAVLIGDSVSYEDLEGTVSGLAVETRVRTIRNQISQFENRQQLDAFPSLLVSAKRRLFVENATSDLELARSIIEFAAKPLDPAASKIFEGMIGLLSRGMLTGANLHLSKWPLLQSLVSTESFSLQTLLSASIKDVQGFSPVHLRYAQAWLVQPPEARIGNLASFYQEGAVKSAIRDDQCYSIQGESTGAVILVGTPEHGIESISASFERDENGNPRHVKLDTPLQDLVDSMRTELEQRAAIKKTHEWNTRRFRPVRLNISRQGPAEERDVHIAMVLTEFAAKRALDERLYDPSVTVPHPRSGQMTTLWEAYGSALWKDWRDPNPQIPHAFAIMLNLVCGTRNVGALSYEDAENSDDVRQLIIVRRGRRERSAGLFSCAVNEGNNADRDITNAEPDLYKVFLRGAKEEFGIDPDVFEPGVNFRYESLWCSPKRHEYTLGGSLSVPYRTREVCDRWEHAEDRQEADEVIFIPYTPDFVFRKFRQLHETEPTPWVRPALALIHFRLIADFSLPIVRLALDRYPIDHIVRFSDQPSSPY